jgi:hypothetical protein
MFSVERVVDGQGTLLKGTYASLDEACERALALQAKEIDPLVTFDVRENRAAPTLRRRKKRIPQQTMPKRAQPTPNTHLSPKKDDMKPLPALFTTRHNDGEDYAVVRVAGGRRDIVLSGFTSYRAAQAFAWRKSMATGIPFSDYHIERVTNIADAEVDTPQASRRRDWEVEDRSGDVSLVERTDEELGLGIPAQTGKGRHSRKGLYIP